MIIDLAGLIQARLKTHCSGFEEIGGLAALEAACLNLERAPAAFVYTRAESPALNPLAAEYISRREITVAITIATRHAEDGAQAALATARQAVREALMNWTPQGCAEALQPAASKMVECINGGFLWEDRYVTSQMTRMAV